MSAPARIHAEPTLAFQAWHSAGDGTQAYPLDCSGARTLAEAKALCPLIHKHSVIVVEHHAVTGVSVQHIYAVKLGKKEYRRCADGQVRNEARMYLDLVASWNIREFAPVEAFQWSPSCDVLGAPAYRVIGA